jgi:hypothetical protein
MVPGEGGGGGGGGVGSGGGGVPPVDPTLKVAVAEKALSTDPARERTRQ